MGEIFEERLPEALSERERDHAMLFRRYLRNSGDKITLETIDKPGIQLESDLKDLQKGLKHKIYGNSIHAIYEAAYAVKDFRAMQFLDWFVKKQKCRSHIELRRSRLLTNPANAKIPGKERKSAGIFACCVSNNCKRRSFTPV